MITIIFGLFVAIIFLFSIAAAIEYRREYHKRMDALMLEDEFVEDFLKTQEMLRSTTFADGEKLIATFRHRWSEVISIDRVEYFVSTLQTSNSYRSQFTFQNYFHNN